MGQIDELMTMKMMMMMVMMKKKMMMLMWRRRKMMRLRRMMLRRNTDPKTGKHNLCEPAQATCAWTFHKSHSNYHTCLLERRSPSFKF